jgi:hypothetical protein
MAAAFTSTLIFKGQNGRQLYIRTTCSDVAAAAWVFPDASTVVVTGGTDTTNSAVYVNQLNTGIVIDHKSNLNTVQNRIFQQNPLGFKAGSQVKFIQAA